MMMQSDNTSVVVALSTIGGLSLKLYVFLTARAQFDSDHGVDFYAPTCFQSATCVGPLFAFYCPFFFKKKKRIMRHFATDDRRDAYAARLMDMRKR